MIPDTSIFLGYWLWQTKNQKRVVANKEPEKYPPPKKNNNNNNNNKNQTHS